MTGDYDGAPDIDVLTRGIEQGMVDLLALLATSAAAGKPRKRAKRRVAARASGTPSAAHVRSEGRLPAAAAARNGAKAAAKPARAAAKPTAGAAKPADATRPAEAEPAGKTKPAGKRSAPASARRARTASREAARSARRQRNGEVADFDA